MKALNSVLKNRTPQKKTRKKSTKKSTKIFVLLWGNLGHYRALWRKGLRKNRLGCLIFKEGVGG